LIRFTNQIFSQSFSQRVTWIQRVFYLAILCIVLRALYLQVIDRPNLEARSNRQYNRNQSVKAQRGAILDYDGNYLAVSLPLKSIFAIPPEIKDKKKAAAQLSKILKLKEKTVLKKLEAPGTFKWLKRNTKPQVSEQIKALGLPGIHFIKEYQRFHPQQNFAAQLIGFTGTDSRGLEGLEYFFNDHLMERKGHQAQWNPFTARTYRDIFSGGSLRLTIRNRLQHYAEKELKKGIDAMSAKDGVAIVMESQTGRILAMAVQPDFDPNRFAKFDSISFFNRAVGAAYEPGSTFKVVTLAAALESKAITRDNIFNCENGTYQIHDRTIHDTSKYGWLSLEKIIQKSSNICAAKIAQLITKPIFYKMIRDFGYGTKTGITLPGEVTGKVYEYQRWSDIDVATMSYGHGISATPLQVITALNTFATGGLLLQPRVVEEARRANGEVVDMNFREPKRIISEEVAELVKGYMIAVTQRGGTAYSARLKNIAVAGKTGTSRKFDRKKREYSSKNHISSFVGFFPAEAPRLTILVVIDEPQKKYLGVKGAIPVFRKIAEHALRFYPNMDFEKPENNEQTPLVENTVFHASTVDLTEKIQGKNYYKQLTKLLKNKTLRETLAIAGRENVRIHTKGSGRVFSVTKDKKKEDTFWVELR